MEFIDYYKTLGITKAATQDEVKKAYRKLARKHHPDLNPNDKAAEKKFQELNEANEVLSDPENRKKYDAYGKDWKHADAFEAEKKQRASHGNSRQYAQQGEQTSDFSDFFESMFGGSGRQQSQTRFRGQDAQASMQLQLTDVLLTQKQTITVNGKNIRLTFPAGIEDGQVIKLAGYGSPGANGGPNGDLYLTFSILNNTVFKRDGSNLHSEVAIDLYTALLGGEIQVETLGGKVKLKVAAETPTGTKVKLKGKGMPVYKKEGVFGDLYITYQVMLPKKLTEEEKALFTQLKNLRSHGND